MCGYLCTGFIGFMLAGKTFTDVTNLFFLPNHSNKNHDIILKYYMTNFCKMIECNSHEARNI